MADLWHGRVDEDDLWDWENNSTIDHLQDIMKMLESWDPNPDTMNCTTTACRALSTSCVVYEPSVATRRHSNSPRLRSSLSIRRTSTGCSCPLPQIKAAGMRPEPCLMS